MRISEIAQDLGVTEEEIVQLLIETGYFKQNGTPYVKYIREGYFTETRYNIKSEEVISVLKQKIGKKLKKPTSKKIKKSNQQMENEKNFLRQTYIGLNKPEDPDEPDFIETPAEYIDDLRSYGLKSVEEHLAKLNKENLDDIKEIEDKIEIEQYELDDYADCTFNNDSLQAEANYYNSLNKSEALKRIYKQKLESDE